MFLGDPENVVQILPFVFHFLILSGPQMSTQNYEMLILRLEFKGKNTFRPALIYRLFSVLLYSSPVVPLFSSPNNIKMVFLPGHNLGNLKDTHSEFYCTCAGVFSLKRTLESTKKRILLDLYIMMVCRWQAFIFVKRKPENIFKPCFQHFDHVMNVQ